MAKKYTEFRRVREQIVGELDLEAARDAIVNGTSVTARAQLVDELVAAIERGIKLGSLARSTRNKHYRLAQTAESRARHLELRLAQIGRVVNDDLIYEDPNLHT